MKALSKSYLEYLAEVSGYRENSTPWNDEQLNKFFEDTDVVSKPFPVVYMLDFTRKNYLLVNDRCKHITGYNANYFLKGGLESYISKWRKFDFDLYNEKIFPANLKILNQLKLDEITDIIFSHSYSFKKSDGQDAKILERISFILDPNEVVPIGAVGSMIDITHFKNNDTIVHTIESVDKNNHHEVRKLLYKKTYFKDESLAQLSEREKEVLKWIFEGLASKQIAGKMRISINTVNNHRRNILQKTNCLNIVELIAYRAKNNLM